MARKLRGFIFNQYGSGVEIKITNACLDNFPKTGKQDESVEAWVEKLRPYLDSIPAELIRRTLKSYGAWDVDELSDDEANLRRWLWLAVGNCKEQKARGEARYLWTVMEP